MESRGPVSSDAPGASPVISSLSTATKHQGALSVYCRRLRRAFLVDSGADVSVFPASPAQKKTLPSSMSLSAANGSSILTFGRRDIFLDLPGLKVVHQFVLADVQKAILGSDFFRSNGLLIDIARQRLVQDGAAAVSYTHLTLPTNREV